MLTEIILVGALRQRVEKCVGWVGGQPPAPARAPVGREPVAGADGVWSVRPPLTWIGSPEARQDWVAGMAATVTDAVRRRKGASALPPGCGDVNAGRGHATAPALDRHVIEVASVSEQAVLCNLVRQYAPVIIAVTGRPQREGGRRLAAARHQVAARHLDAADASYRSLLEAHLRGTEGLPALDHTDVYPAAEPDGTPTVVVQCVDAAATLAAVRAHAILLAAFALRARRLVSEGVQADKVPQHVVEENRARAVALGLKARATDGGKGTVQPTYRTRARKLLADTLAIELDNLGAAPEELFPVLAPVELPALGLARLSTEDAALLDAAGGADSFAAVAARALTDVAPGGPCLAAARKAAEGRTWLLLDRWAGVIAARRGGVRAQAARPAASGAGKRTGGPKPSSAGKPAGGRG
jgi:hypothetical protein